MNEKKITDQIREQVMEIYASVGNEEMEQDMYSIALIHSLLETLDDQINELQKSLGRLREDALKNEERLEAEKAELEKKLNYALKVNDTLKDKLAGKQLDSEW